MAEEHAGQRQGGILTAPWMRLFTAFRVAIDPQKLFLAAAGLLAMSLGWWLLAVIFYSPVVPQWSEFAAEKDQEQAFKNFTTTRRQWNLRHEMAGYLTEPPTTVDAGDVAGTLREFQLLSAIEKSVRQFNKAVLVVIDDKESYFKFDAKSFTFTVDPKVDDLTRLKAQKDVKVGQVQILTEADKRVNVAGTIVTLDSAKDLQALKEALKDARTLERIRFEAETEKDGSKRDERLAALAKYETLLANPKIKPFGRLRTLPWWEERGPNPYLLVTGRAHPDQSQGVVNWLITEQAPVLLEPLFKLMTPIKYWFDPAGGIVNRFYLFLVIIWMLVVWGVFGGAITRMAIVQVARNEKVGAGEAIGFVRARIQSYITAPLFPLVFLAGLSIFLFFFGLFEQIPLLGDVIVAGLFWPVVLIFGLIMAVVLLGLVGWPLMYATLSAEGSDSFDAISRSYSYVFQATWSYIFYGVMALLYGAVLVFFVGFLSSVMVYMGKWGVSNANFWQSRDPSYLFANAPTSFGWRDLLLDKSAIAESTPVVLESGQIVYRNRLKPADASKLVWYNNLGSLLVSLWLCVFFMLVVGFGYSYFWTSSSIIYLLMRLKVDDTEIDEIHMDDAEDDFTPPAYAPPDHGKTAPAAQPKPAAAPASNVTMVESPTLRTPTAATTPASSSPPPTASTTSSAPAATPTSSTPAAEVAAPRIAPKTMLAAPDEDPDEPPAKDGPAKASNGDDV